MGGSSHPQSAPVATAGTIDAEGFVFGLEEGRQGLQLVDDGSLFILEGAFIMSVFKSAA